MPGEREGERLVEEKGKMPFERKILERSLSFPSKFTGTFLPRTSYPLRLKIKKFFSSSAGT